MASVAQRLAGAASASREAFELGPTPCLGFKSTGLSGKFLAGSIQNGSRLQCAVSVVPKKKDNLLAVAEQHWLRAVESPLDGLSFSADDFSQALSRYDFNFEMGQTVKGVIFLADKNGAFVDIGAKAPAFLPTTEASILKLKSVLEAGLVPGVEDDFLIIKDNDENGRMILSLKKIQLELAWERCKQLQAEDATVTAQVLGTNRGGFVVDLEGLKGFVPFSHVSSKTPFDDLINKIIPLKFMEVDNEVEQVRLVLSNKKALAENQIALGIGSVVEGVVQSVKPYGAFIDMGGISGLLHVSQISHERIADVGNVLQPGDKLKVMILSQDRERGRISLSTKRLEPTPGDMLRNPALVYESAEEMAQTFRQRIAQAEAAARAEELRMAQEGGSFGLILEELDTDSVPSAV